MKKRRAILVFAKAPEPGRVKTRLLDVLSPVQAAALHARLTLDTLRRVSQIGSAEIYLYAYPDISHPFFPRLSRRFPLILRKQQGNDLGERMLRALSETLATHHHALLVGCDCPSLTPDLLQQAFKALEEGHDIVLGPAEDGGYVLIGATRPPLAALFQNISWGGPTVLQDTLYQVRTNHLNHALLATQWDLDRPQDLERYIRIRGLRPNTPEDQ